MSVWVWLGVAGCGWAISSHPSIFHSSTIYVPLMFCTSPNKPLYAGSVATDLSRLAQNNFVRKALLNASSMMKTPSRFHTGYEPESKKAKYVGAEADRAEVYLSPNQPGRVQLSRCSWHHDNRGGQQILPPHAHDVAADICENRTSKRRYGAVKVVEVPDKEAEAWLAANRAKAKQNSLLANFEAMSQTGPYYAILKCNHFVEACKIIKEGHRKYMDKAAGMPLQLQEDDKEGKLIQEQGVTAVVYSSAMWHDDAAVLAIMREDNLDAQVAKAETELDSFGFVHKICKNIAKGYEPEGGTISVKDVIAEIAKVGYGNLALENWKHLVQYRLLLSPAQGDMLLDCLFQVCNGRVSTPTKTYVDIANLHPKKHAWPKTFILMETYCSDLLSEEHGEHKAISQTGPQAKKVRTLDPTAIALLAKEKALLDEVTHFFSKVVKHYSRPSQAAASSEKKLLANATLMKALGRTLWKVAEALHGNKKQGENIRGRCEDIAPVVRDREEEKKLVQTIIKDSFWKIEARYANHMTKAGVFEGGEKRPAPLYARKAEKAISQTPPPQETAAVKINSKGEVDTAENVADICKALGLKGDGVGQQISVRSHETLIGSGVALFATKITIVSWNPPEVDIAVEGKIHSSNSEESNNTITKTITIDVDDLVPLEVAQKKTETKSPLEFGYEPDMPRAPPLQQIETVTAYMKSALQTTMLQLISATAPLSEKQVELVYITDPDKEQGQSVIQCRTLVKIKKATLRLYPHSGTLLHVNEHSARNKEERKSFKRPCYVRGVHISAVAARIKQQGGPTAELQKDFILYSAMSQKQLAVIGMDDKPELHYYPPFWAVMLAGRDTSAKVNMSPYMEEYTTQPPRASDHGQIMHGACLKLQIPFLANTRDLEPGELLVLPFDGGLPQLICEAFPPMQSTRLSSAMSQNLI